MSLWVRLHDGVESIAEDLLHPFSNHEVSVRYRRVGKTSTILTRIYVYHVSSSFRQLFWKSKILIDNFQKLRLFRLQLECICKEISSLEMSSSTSPYSSSDEETANIAVHRSCSCETEIFPSDNEM